jgi:hypothetical protein
VQSVAAAEDLDATLPSPAPRGTTIVAMSSADDSYGVRTDRVKILAGQMWDPANPHAVMIDQQLAACVPADRLHRGNDVLQLHPDPVRA